MFGTDFENLETKDRILAVAMDMFFTKEYGKVTLKEIADASGVTKGGIYHYFESKDHLLAEGIKFTFQMIMSEMDSLLEKNISAKEVIASWFNIEKMMGAYAGVLTGEEATENLLQFMYLMLTSVKKSPEIKSLLSGLYMDSIDKIEDIFIRAQDSGEIRKDLNPRGLAVQMVTSFEGATLLGGIAEDFDIVKLGQEIFESFWTQIKA
ncbi:TetR/AcrR family transcriptional regulator [Fusibacter sp. JL216-2]|uniref:TetR/AcrR family transcriptional regulator n=1 Tax=Fusibacter sp. JL216-2 TaxID=3071453 RepID=UPI003D330EB3